MIRSAGLLFLFLSISLMAYGQIDDIGMWTGVTVEHKFTRKLSGAYNQQLRMYKDLYQVDQLLSQFSVTYAVTKYFRTELAYRYSYKDREGYYSNRHRIQLDLSFRHKFGKLVFQLRERIQRMVVDPGASENGHIPQWTWRNRLLIKPDLDRKYEPYVSVEQFFLLSNADKDPFGLNRLRYEIGFDYSFNRIHSVNPFLMFQYGLPEKDNRLVYGIGYTFSI